MLVVLSEAKELVHCERRHQLLRFAQDDKRHCFSVATNGYASPHNDGVAPSTSRFLCLVPNEHLLTPLLSPAFCATGHSESRLQRALAADPALTGRVSYDAAGTIVLTGPVGGPPPGSAKERQRWELHVRLRLAAELGQVAAAAAMVRWAEPGASYPAP